MRKMFRFLFWVVLTTTVVIGLLRLTAIRWWRVPLDDKYLTASISPSVRAGDLILLWRLTRPSYGDLVLCPEPGHPERVVIGRLIGEAGDEVSTKGAKITVNGRALPTESRCAEGTFTEQAPDGDGSEVEQACSLELVGGVLHMRGEVPPEHVTPPQDAAIESVPEQHVYLLSDNRLFPYDSRDYGPVPRASCQETVFFRLVSSRGYFDTEHRNQIIR